MVPSSPHVFRKENRRIVIIVCQRLRLPMTTFGVIVFVSLTTRRPNNAAVVESDTQLQRQRLPRKKHRGHKDEERNYTDAHRSASMPMEGAGIYSKAFKHLCLFCSIVGKPTVSVSLVASREFLRFAQIAKQNEEWTSRQTFAELRAVP